MKCHENEEAFLKLSMLLARVIGANNDKPIPYGDKRLFDAEGLAIKYFLHILSFLQIYRGTLIPELKADYFDAASANVIARAALESFLVFHDIFISSKTDDEKDLKHSAWILHGLIERSRSPGLSLEARKIIYDSKQESEAVRSKIKINPSFCTLKPEIQKKILKGREWRLSSWREMALAAGLSEIHANTFYRFLCGYAHAGNISVSQIHQAQTALDQKMICSATFNVVIISIANMIVSYAKVFADSQRILDSVPEANRLIDFWIRMGSTSIAPE